MQLFISQVKGLQSFIDKFSKVNIGFRFGATDTDSFFLVLDKTIAFDKITASVANLNGTNTPSNVGLSVIFSLYSDAGVFKGATVPLLFSTATNGPAVSAAISNLIGVDKDRMVITLSAAPGAGKQVSVNIEGIQ